MNIKKIIADNSELITDMRRDLHRIPELGMQEKKTSAYIEQKLSQLKLEIQCNIAGHGIVGLLKTGRPGPTILIRADMDALPINEETNLPFSSNHPGKMHACGHDGHMAIGLGVATILSKIEHQLSGTIKFVFQPAEEGPGGAKPMIEAGVLENPKVDFITGCHIWPNIPIGTVGVKKGPLMAASDLFDLLIKGVGSHGATPHLGVDTLEVATQIVGALQRIVSRQINPLIPAVVTIGSFHSGSTYNIIPSVAEIKGTVRTFDKTTWNELPKRIKKIVDGICQAMGAEYELNYRSKYPLVINDSYAADIVIKASCQTVGEENTIVPEMSMCAEDVSYFLEQVKGCFFFLGAGNANNKPLHNSRFDFEETVLATGVEVICRTAISVLARQ